jgi:hypothetical protein
MDSFQDSLRRARNLHADIGGIGYGPQRFAQIPLRLVALGNLLPFAREPDTRCAAVPSPCSYRSPDPGTRDFRGPLQRILVRNGPHWVVSEDPRP